MECNNKISMGQGGNMSCGDKWGTTVVLCDSCKVISKLSVDNLVLLIREKLPLLTEEDREGVMEEIKNGYCSHCMSSVLPCHCWNDE